MNSKNIERPQVGAGVIIIRDGKTLLARRKGAHGSGSWGSMGGHVEFGESLIETVQRESMEELGIRIGNIKFLTCINMVKEGKHYIDVSFLAEILDGEPIIREPDKIEEIGWFPIDNLPSPLFRPVEACFKTLATGESYFEFNET